MKLSTELASKRIGVKQDKLEEWEEGKAKPTIKQLYSIAKIYQRPFAVFYFPKPPQHFKPLKDFRKFDLTYIIAEDEEYQLQKEILLFQRKRQQALELYELLDRAFIEFKLKLRSSEEPKDAAQKICKYLKINHKEIANTDPGYDALNYWKKFLQEKGILIFQTSRVPLNIMRGACIADSILPVIIINSNDSQNGRIFTLLHELTHLALREDSISNFRYSNKAVYDKIEIFCNQVAAEILVPEELLLHNSIVKEKTSPRWTSVEIKNLSRLFCVSEEVIFRRLLTLRRTTKLDYQNFRDSFKQRPKKKSKGGDYYRNVIAKNGRHFLELALQGYYQEKVTASNLFDYTRVKLSNLKNLEQTLYAKL